jgi:hypothetical protein
MRHTDWRLKVIGLWIFSCGNAGRQLYDVFQRRVTKSRPRPVDNYRVIANAAKVQFGNFALNGPVTGKLYFEFGAGWDLFNNIALYCLGIDRQLVVDLNDYMLVDYVNASIAYLTAHPLEGAVRNPPGPIKSHADLEKMYGISYRAPFDARRTGLPDGSVSFIGTIDTLEHIPFDSLKDILLECRRIATPDAIVSMQIDYTDHFAHADSRLTPYNFLKFSDSAWWFLNPPIHYQNRKRHADYRKLFDEAGFSILSDNPERPERWSTMLGTIRPAVRFRGVADEVLSITRGTYLLRPGT